jgi:hypothetical protein
MLGAAACQMLLRCCVALTLEGSSFNFVYVSLQSICYFRLVTSRGMPGLPIAMARVISTASHRPLLMFSLIQQLICVRGVLLLLILC